MINGVELYEMFSCVCGDDHVIFVFSSVDVLGHID